MNTFHVRLEQIERTCMARLIHAYLRRRQLGLMTAPVLLSGVLMAMAYPATAIAQQNKVLAPTSSATTSTNRAPRKAPPSKTSAATLKGVLVTGSRIRTPNAQSAAPVTSVPPTLRGKG